MIKSVLIVNRGEIASRIIQTASRLGIKTISIYSDADAGALYTEQADRSVSIGGNLPQESYLNQKKILEIARKECVEAIHPGYGFLSENAEFCRACRQAGFIFIGPNPETIEAMGRKDLAKEIMAKAGVPVTPGYYGQDQSLERFKTAAEEVGYPVLLKASMGGGGKGIRRVDQKKALSEAFFAAKREAMSSFGNDLLLIEKYIEKPRHIEIQILADQSGNIVHLYERECSLQRRHQKVIEEAPVADMTETVRKAMTEAALRAAQSVHYLNAGTVEFIVDGKGTLKADRFWFMEMNTRLQVEHAVTEAILGLDLVEWQFRIASGDCLPEQSKFKPLGHAVEARVYAENPETGFLPSTGKLEIMSSPESFIRGRKNFWLALSARERACKRSRKKLEDDSYAFADVGFQSGDILSAFYDPMLAKVISWGKSREGAIHTLIDNIKLVQIWPVKTNINFLQRLLGHKAFLNQNFNTAFIEEEKKQLIEPLSENIWVISACLGRLISRILNMKNKTLQDPWAYSDGFLINQASKIVDSFEIEGAHYSLTLNQETRKEYQIYLSETQSVFVSNFFWKRDAKQNLIFSYLFEGKQIEVSYLLNKQDAIIFISGNGKKIREPYSYIEATLEEDQKDIRAPMSGRVISVPAIVGTEVDKGEALVIIEAMKMEMVLKAKHRVKIAEVYVKKGDLIQEGKILVLFSTPEN